MTRFALCAVVLAACGGDSKTQDAAVTHDSPTSSTVQMVTCPATPAATVTTSGFMYSPVTTTITQGQIVQFMPASEHDVEPGHTPTDATIADPGLSVGFGATKCLMFTQAGMYGFHCGPHHFNGTIVVQ
ncbi:MAG TPA: plastocyanin/azurin family copper-binding protein [Kofleriaceae bacterium]|nr:plastocyanin/azurin family copper-binding protein [Kofleriaceae bacterium]